MLFKFIDLVGARRDEVTVSSETPLPIELAPDAEATKLAHVRVTLGAAETVHVINIPDWAKGFRLYPTANPCRFAINEDPGALATDAATPTAVVDLGVGGIAVADAWEVRLLAMDAGRTLRLRSATLNLVADVDFF